MSIACVICGTRSPRHVGTLCATCAANLVIGERRAPGIFAARPIGSPAAWLIDCWGQLHAIAERCLVGRDQQRCDFVIADLTVSVEHAELWRDRKTWRVRDRGSSNGTRIGTRGPIAEAVLHQRDRVWFGSVAFVFWADAEPPAREVPLPEVRTLVPAGAAFRLDGPGAASIVIRAARGHQLGRAPGELEYRADTAAPVRRVALPRLQFQLMRALCAAAVSAGSSDDAWVRSRELVASLPFQSPNPEPNHVRQVVATLRTTLTRAGVNVGDRPVLQGREGLGYRVCWEVTPLGEVCS